jgi:membrane protease YdiL (CAAX protease family)
MALKRLYERSELAFSLVWIVAYVVLMSLADSLSSLVGVEKSVTLPVSLVLALALIIWIKRMALTEKYGLTPGRFPFKAYLGFIPLAIIVSVNFWGGVSLNYTVWEAVLYVASMLCVGIVEEVIFRGFLFKYLARGNLTVAIIVSSVTFGFGHVINLVSGVEVIPTLLQIAYATAAGFLFTVIFYRSGSLLPCIITHSLINATSVICVEGNLTMSIITASVLVVVSVGYAVLVWFAGGSTGRQKT